MNDFPAFARHFAQLVWLLVHRGEDPERQKEALRRSLGELEEKRQVLVLADLSFSMANRFQDPRLNDFIVWVSELSMRMSAHSVRAIEFEQAASPHEVLGIARALAGSPVTGDEGEAFDDKVVALAPRTLAVHIGDLGFVRRATPISGNAILAPVRTPPLGAPIIATTSRPTPSQPNGSAVAPNFDEDIADQQTRTLESELVPGLAASMPLRDLLARVDEAKDSSTATRLIDDIARAAEERAREGLWVDVAEILDRLYRNGEKHSEGELKRACRFAIRRLERPAIMKGIAQLLPHRREMRDTVAQLLAHAGESGADALIDLLISSDSTTERHAYRAALAKCPAAVPALVHLLRDARWYVVRNAAELLGELAPPDADAQLAGVLGHGEPRVRRAAVTALARLATPRAVLALLQAVHDPAAEVRLQVALGLGAMRNPRAVPWLIEALDKEHDAEVQAVMIAALGNMPTEEAVARLARAAQPGGFLIRKAVATRVQAVHALAEAGTSSAQAVLRGLAGDRDRSVREAADRALSGRVLA